MKVYDLKQADGTNYLTGDTFPGRHFEVIINNTPKDLTATQIKCEIRYGQKTGPVVKTLTVDEGFTKTDADAGKFRMNPFDITWRPGPYFYDIQFTDGEEVKTYIGGTITIDQDVTK